MSNGGGAVARRGGVVLGIAACLLLAACGAGGDSDLDERVAELEQENQALRAQLEAMGTTEDTGVPDGSADITTASTPSSSGSSTPPSSTSSTVAPTTTLPPVPGSRENPHPLGEPIPAGDWTYTVIAFEPNVDDVVAFLSPNNEPAGTDKVYSRLRLRAVYNGQGAGDPRRLKVNLVSPTETIVGDVSPCCQPQRDMLTDQPETFAGGSAEGWIYYSVTAADLFMGSFVAFDPNADQTNVPGGVVFFFVN